MLPKISITPFKLKKYLLKEQCVFKAYHTHPFLLPVTILTDRTIRYAQKLPLKISSSTQTLILIIPLF